MRKAFTAATCSILLVALLSSLPLLGSAQTREKFGISARAGGVNAVTGRARVHGQGAAEWQDLMITANLETGDVVKTGADGRVEVLLNPGSYMRLAENSEFELSNNSAENLEVRLIKGTAIMEVTGAEDTELLINITTPHTRMAIVRRGLYRVNVVPGDATELIVRKGRVTLEGSHTKIKGGNKVVFSGGSSFAVAKLHQDEKKGTDVFEGWSQGRADTLGQANRKLERQELDVFRRRLNDPWRRSFPRLSAGMWVYNMRASCYTFMPFYSGWDSPYGTSYSSIFYNGYLGIGCCGFSPDRDLRRPDGGFPNGSGTTSTGPGTQPSARAPGEVPAGAQRKIEQAQDRLP